MTTTKLEIPESFRLFMGHLPISGELADPTATIPFTKADVAPCPHGQLFRAFEDEGLLAVTLECGDQEDNECFMGSCVAREAFIAGLKVTGKQWSHGYTDEDGLCVEFYRDGDAWEAMRTRRAQAGPELLEREQTARKEREVSEDLHAKFMDDLIDTAEAEGIQDAQPIQGCEHGTVYGTVKGVAVTLNDNNLECDYLSCEAVVNHLASKKLLCFDQYFVNKITNMLWFHVEEGRAVTDLVTDWLCEDLDD